MKLTQKQNRNSGITSATTPGQRVPLSFSQEILWLATVLQSESIYNEFFALKLTGHLDTESLKSALKELVRRHWTLRTHIELHESTPVQIVAESAEFERRDYVLSDLSSEEQAREVDKRAREARSRHFDLARDFMLRAELIQFAGQEHMLLLTTHHISCDGWSHGVFLYELMTLYDAFAQGRPSPLTEMPIQYSDFAAWQRECMQGSVLEKHLKYWRGQLAGMESLELPADFLRTSSGASTGGSEFVCIAPELTSQLRELCRGERVSLFMALAAALQIVLGRWAGQTDVSIGTPVANRPSGCESLIGYFVNQLVLRTDLGGNPTIHELLGRVRTTCLNGYAHQDLPFEKLVNDLDLAQDMQAGSLLRVVFAFTEELQFEASGNGLTVRLLPVEAQPFARFDLLLSLNGVNNELQGGLVYNTALFEAATIRRVLTHLERVLQAMVSSPDQRVDELLLINAEERRQLLNAGNALPLTHRPAKCLHQLFEEQVGRTPDAVAVTYEQRSLSYTELNQRANRLAQYLRMFGVGPEVRVGLCLNRSLEMVIAVFATLKAGGSYVPMDPAYPQERLAYMLADAEVKVLLIEAEFASRFSSDICHILSLDSDWEAAIAGHSLENFSNNATPENAAYIIYTSGSTGKPKGVVVTHRNVAELMASTEAAYVFGPGDVWTLFHSYAFDFSVWEIWGALLYGGRLVIVPYLVSRSPEAFCDLVRSERVTVLNQTPAAFRQFIQAESQGAGGLNLRWIVFGGEALQLESLRPWWDRHGEQQPVLVNMYGITETTVHVTYRPLSKADLSKGAAPVIGGPIPGWELYILNEYGEPVPIGTAGEIYVGGAGLARGYWKRPALTAERLFPILSAADLARDSIAQVTGPGGATMVKLNIWDAPIR